MDEINKILKAYDATDFSTRKAALATVIKVEGSSYRSPGARMYLTDNGKWIGSISGGCLEGDALRKSRKVISDGMPQVVTYDTMDDDANSLGVGLGCNGIIHVLLEPINENSDVIAGIRKIASFDDVLGVATVYCSSEVADVPSASRLVIDKSGAVVYGQEHKTLVQYALEDLISSLQDKKSITKKYNVGEGVFEVFLEVFEPAIDLIVFGGGFDAKPLVSFAQQLGWHVRIVDECIAHLFPANFPDAQVVSCDRKSVTKEVELKPFSAAVLMSHNLNYDFEVLQQLVETDIYYVGVLGPKKRADKLYEKLSDSGRQITDNDHRRIHSPIGLDIGADTPEEIALSIIAEIKARFASRSGGFLKYRSGSIHDKDNKTGQVFKQVYLNKPIEQLKEKSS